VHDAHILGLRFAVLQEHEVSTRLTCDRLAGGERIRVSIDFRLVVSKVTPQMQQRTTAADVLCLCRLRSS
jgi:hypothetical protein